MLQTPPPYLDAPVTPSTEDLLRELAQRLRSLEQTLRLMQDAKIDYNPIPPMK